MIFFLLVLITTPFFYILVGIKANRAVTVPCCCGSQGPCLCPWTSAPSSSNRFCQLCRAQERSHSLATCVLLGSAPLMTFLEGIIELRLKDKSQPPNRKSFENKRIDWVCKGIFKYLIIFIDFIPNLFYLDELFCFQLFYAASLSLSLSLNLCSSILFKHTSWYYSWYPHI